MTTIKQSFDLILFDLGGVIVQLAGVQQMLAWSKQLRTGEVLWEQWLASTVVRDFESGRSTPDRFADQMVREFNLPVSAKQFLSAFVRWPKCPYSGSKRLLAQLASQCTLGILSNTNELHWQRIRSKMNFIQYFDWTFPSHLTGRLKPDQDAFGHVITTTGCLPARILFFDDNQMNVDTARKMGINGYTVSGISGVVDRLNELGLIDPA